MILSAAKLLNTGAVNCMCKKTDIETRCCQAFIKQIQLRFKHTEGYLGKNMIESSKSKKDVHLCTSGQNFRLNSNFKYYSASSVFTPVIDEAIFAEKENKDELLDSGAMKSHSNRVMFNLLAFLDVSINSNLNNLAYSTLEYYHNTYQRLGMPLNDIQVYNCALEGAAAEGNWLMFEHIMNMVSNESVKPNFQTFVYAIECAYRAEKYDAISGILEKIKLQGFDINNIFSECKFVRDQRKIVLKAIRTQIPNLKPIKRIQIGIYKSKLLESLNKSSPLAVLYNPLVPNTTSENLKDLTEEQLECEKQGLRRIRRIDYNPNFTEEKAILMKKLEDCQSKWKEQMLEKFLIELRFRSSKTGDNVSIAPYLSCLEPKEFVELIYQQFLTLAQHYDSFTADIRDLKKELGLKVMDKYFLKRKMKNGVFDQTMKLYTEYCDYLVNPGLTSRYSPRQYWELLREKYSDGPDIEQQEPKWSNKTVIEVGNVIFTVMQQVITLDLNLLENKIGKNKKIERPFFTYFRAASEHGAGGREIRHNPDGRRFWKLLTEGTLTFHCSQLPMLSPPIPWNSASSGGYFLNYSLSQINLIRTGNSFVHNHIRQTDTQNLLPNFDSLNHIAECPWIINKQIFNLMLEVYKSWSENESDFPEMKKKTNPEKEQLSRLLLGRRRAQLSESPKRDLLSKLTIANEYRERVFWFPHNVDFRGRIYPITTNFHYHLTDVDRGLLLFARGEPLGKEGLDWLKIHLVNLTGFKKRCSLQERLDYCNELLPEIADSADNSLKGNKWWQKSDSPWQTLACCIELTSALRSPDPYAYVCHIPVHQDGFCNGLQHFAALGRDCDIASQVNLVPDNVPHDLYSNFAHAVEQERQKDAEAGDQVALFLDGYIDRSFIKLPLLAIVYGSSIKSAAAPLVKQIKEVCKYSTDEQQQMAAQYLIDKIWPLFQKRFSTVINIQNWFSECATLISQIHDKSVEWHSPVGFPIMQPYYKTGSVMVKKITRFQKEKEFVTKELSTSKQAKSFSSNYIHSLDATHLLLTSLFCRRKGISFVGVHDSFWTHPKHIAEMNKICREQFVALYNEPLLESLSEQLIQQFCDVEKANLQEDLIHLHNVLSKIPSKGLFDLAGVHNSPYFFS